MKKNSFKKRLRQTREEIKLSQIEFANLLNINTTTYRNYENTDREPDYDTLMDMSDILGISIDYLLGQTDIKKDHAPLSESEKLLNEIAEIFNSVDDISKGKILERARAIQEEYLKKQSIDKAL
ncbi:MAG: helix-turn-helix transcriptional regulator [Eubacteriales bacterium]|nr:helix-turn-helix transcriptional regulator [Eubacteriales bacterium]